MNSNRDPFGRLISDPEDLTLADRVDILRGLAGHFQADGRRDVAWLGDRLSAWLAGRVRGDLEHALGLVAPRGSKVTPQALLERERRDRLLVRFAVACGGDRAALQAAQGGDCPASARGLLSDLRAMGLPGSSRAFSRARRRMSRHR